MRRWPLAALCLLGPACSVPSLQEDESAPTKNACSADADCGTGNICTAGACRAPKSNFDTVLVTITPPAADTSPAGGLSLLTTLKGASQPIDNLALALEAPVRVRGTLQVGKGQGEECAHYGAASDRTIPARVTFSPEERPLGLPAKSYVVQTKPSFAGPEVESNVFALDLPSGDYDVYVEPTQPPEGGAPPGGYCSVVPQVFRSLAIEPDGDIETPDGVQLKLPVAEPASLTVTIRWPSEPGEPTAGGAPPSLESWVADMIEPRSGRVISTPLVLPPAEFSLDYPDEVKYVIPLAYSQQSGDDMGQELFRLRPPEGVAAPAMVWNREGLEVLTVGEAEIDLRSLPAQTVEVEGVVETSAGEPVAADVTVTSVQVDTLEAGLLASFGVQAVAGPDGKFVVELLPGTYRVVAEPKDGLPATQAEWQVAATGGYQAGRVIALEDPGSIGGRVVASIPGAPPVVGASVHAFVSPSRSSQNAFKNLSGPSPFLPRASNGTTDDDGRFVLDADPGTFDLSIRPAVETGFPWLVRPRVAVPSPSLGKLELPLPVVHEGVATIGGKPASGARIGVFVYVGAANAGYVTAPDEADSVLQVAESVADESGAFEVLLPAKLN